jgi:hypothetical protein
MKIVVHRQCPARSNGWSSAPISISVSDPALIEQICDDDELRPTPGLVVDLIHPKSTPSPNDSVLIVVRRALTNRSKTLIVTEPKLVSLFRELRWYGYELIRPSDRDKAFATHP